MLRQAGKVLWVFAQMVLLSLALLNTQVCMAQSAEELSKLPKEKLVAMAASKISEPSFKASDFTIIEVWLEDGELTVNFQHAIKFIPKKGQYYYHVSVDLISGTTGRSIEGKGPDRDDIEFYNPAKFQSEIRFVLDAINKSEGEVGKISEGQLPDGTMTIREEAGYYDITVDSYSTHSFYKIKKGSGKIYDAGHKHFYRSEGSEPKRKQIY